MTLLCYIISMVSAILWYLHCNVLETLQCWTKVSMTPKIWPTQWLWDCSFFFIWIPSGCPRTSSPRTPCHQEESTWVTITRCCISCATSYCLHLIVIQPAFVSYEMCSFSVTPLFITCFYWRHGLVIFRSLSVVHCAVNTAGHCYQLLLW